MDRPPTAQRVYSRLERRLNVLRLLCAVFCATDTIRRAAGQIPIYVRGSTDETAAMTGGYPAKKSSSSESEIGRQISELFNTAFMRGTQRKMDPSVDESPPMSRPDSLSVKSRKGRPRRRLPGGILINTQSLANSDVTEDYHDHSHRGSLPGSVLLNQATDAKAEEDRLRRQLLDRAAPKPKARKQSRSPDNIAQDTSNNSGSDEGKAAEKSRKKKNKKMPDSGSSDEGNAAAKSHKKTD